MIAIVDTREHRIQSGRSGILASNQLIAKAARPTKGLKRKRVEQRGERGIL
jgi:hypothetical protein